jgi:hypothetical protein
MYTKQVYRSLQRLNESELHPIRLVCPQPEDGHVKERGGYLNHSFSLCLGNHGYLTCFGDRAFLYLWMSILCRDDFPCFRVHEPTSGRGYTNSAVNIHMYTIHTTHTNGFIIVILTHNWIVQSV